MKRILKSMMLHPCNGMWISMKSCWKMNPPEQDPRTQNNPAPDPDLDEELR